MNNQNQRKPHDGQLKMINTKRLRMASKDVKPQEPSRWAVKKTRNTKSFRTVSKKVEPREISESAKKKRIIKVSGWTLKNQNHEKCHD